MKSIAIIAEFNPFHTGHQKLIDTLRDMYPDVPVIVIMSGSFVQRGEPAMFDKWHRAQWAVSCGADLVVELPCAFALSGAEGFASGGVRLANALGCSHIACGIEEGSTADMMELAKTAAELDVYDYLEKARADGLPYGAALSQALADALPEKAALLHHPNTLLAFEYAKAIINAAPHMTLITIPRDTSHHGNGSNSSAIRKAIRDHVPKETYRDAIPAPIRTDWEDCLQQGNYVDEDRYHDLILYQSRLLTEQQLAALAAFSEGIEHRWHNMIATAAAWQDGLEALKTRRYPYSRLCRMAAYTTLGIRKDAMAQWLQDGPQYARILAMSPAGSIFLHVAREPSPLTFITKITKADKELSPSARTMLALDLVATDVQYLCMHERACRLSRQDYYMSPIIGPLP